MLHNFGKVHSLPHSKGRTDFQLNFVATSRRNSLIVISMVADDLKAVVNTLVTYIYMPCHRCITFLSMCVYRSPGRIIEAYIDPFESLSVDGLLMVIVQNTGMITATYQVNMILGTVCGRYNYVFLFHYSVVYCTLLGWN